MVTNTVTECGFLTHVPKCEHRTPMGLEPYRGIQQQHECEGTCGHVGTDVPVIGRQRASKADRRAETHDMRWARLARSLGDVPARDESYWTPTNWRGDDALVRPSARTQRAARNGPCYRVMADGTRILFRKARDESSHGKAQRKYDAVPASTLADKMAAISALHKARMADGMTFEARQAAIAE